MRLEFVRFAQYWNDGRLLVKHLTYFKSIVIIGLSLPGFLCTANGSARMGPSHSYAMVVAQNETRPTAKENNAAAPENNKAQIETDKKEAPSGADTKPLKDFQPSEKIEAEQAVDFPYDI